MALTTFLCVVDLQLPFGKKLNLIGAQLRYTFPPLINRLRGTSKGARKRNRRPKLFNRVLGSHAKSVSMLTLRCQACLGP